MTLDKYAYEILEMVYKNLTDDISIDIRLVKDIIVEQREIDIYRRILKYRAALPYTQLGSYSQDVQSVFIKHSTPVSAVVDCIPANNWLVSDDKNEFIEYLGGPAIFYIRADYDSDKYSPKSFAKRIKFTSSDRAINVGHGRFNKNQKLAFSSDDKIIIVTLDSQYVDDNDGSLFYINGILKDPRTAPDYSDTTSDFPIGSGWGYYKQFVYNDLIRKIQGPEDKINDSSDQQIRTK